MKNLLTKIGAGTVGLLLTVFALMPNVASATTFIVPQGGTGIGTATAHGTLVGEGTSAFNVVAPATAGYVLTSNGGSADPTFQVVTSNFNATTPLNYSAGTLTIQKADTSHDGYISSTDWNTFNGKQSALTFSTGLTNTGGTVTVNTTQSISALSNITTNGFLQTSGGNGTLSSAALTSGQITTALGFTPISTNQTITLSGDVSGSGTTAITTAIGANKVTLADIAQIGANTILGNKTGATGNVSAIATSSLGVALSDTTGTLTVLRGGTGLTSFTGDNLLYTNHAGTAILSAASSTLSIGGNAATATALAANGTNCSAGNYPLGVDASGNSESCTAANLGTVTSVGLSSSNSTLTIGATPITTSGVLTADLNLAHSNTWSVLQSFALSSTTISSIGKLYVGGTATTSIDSGGNIVIPSTATLTNTGVSNGCASWSSGVLTSLGVACGTGSGGLTSVGLSDSNSTLTIGSSPLVANGTITATLNLAHSNTWSVLQTFTYASTTAISNSYASSTNDWIGTLHLPNLATGILHSVSGLISSSAISLTADVTGILPIANGGTATSTSPAYGKVLVGNLAGTGYDYVATSTFGGGASPSATYQDFTASGTWTKPAACGTGNEMVVIQGWGGGGGGSTSGNTASGGGGGYNEMELPCSTFGSTVTVTIGAGGGTNVAGTDSTFGSFLTAYGGGKGVSGQGGGGGGTTGDGGSPGGGGGTQGGAAAAQGGDSGWGGGGGGSSAGGGQSSRGGGGGASGANVNNTGGNSVWGGGGGGAGTPSSGGTSVYGGAGGSNGGSGTAPGGGGSIGGSGARGEIRVWVVQS